MALPTGPASSWIDTTDIPSRLFETGGTDYELYEADEEFVLSVEMPGFDTDEIDVSWDDGVLTIAAEHEDERRGERKTYHRRFRFPKTVDDEAIEARYTNGILEVRLPVMAGATSRGKRIEIESYPRWIVFFVIPMQLTVKQSKNRDPGSRMAVIDPEGLRKLDASSGHFVRLEGHDGRVAVAKARPSDTAGAWTGIVRIDGELRRTAGASIEHAVDVGPTDVASAERVTVALPDSIRVRGDLGPHLREELDDQALKAGQTVAVAVCIGTRSSRAGRRIPVRIVDTRPGGAVCGRTSHRHPCRRPSRRGESGRRRHLGSAGRPPGVTYEAVGGPTRSWSKSAGWSNYRSVIPNSLGRSASSRGSMSRSTGRRARTRR